MSTLVESLRDEVAEFCGFAAGSTEANEVDLTQLEVEVYVQNYGSYGNSDLEVNVSGPVVDVEGDPKFFYRAYEGRNATVVLEALATAHVRTL